MQKDNCQLNKYSSYNITKIVKTKHCYHNFTSMTLLLKCPYSYSPFHARSLTHTLSHMTHPTIPWQTYSRKWTPCHYRPDYLYASSMVCQCRVSQEGVGLETKLTNAEVSKKKSSNFCRE